MYADEFTALAVHAVDKWQ